MAGEFYDFNYIFELDVDQLNYYKNICTEEDPSGLGMRLPWPGYDALLVPELSLLFTDFINSQKIADMFTAISPAHPKIPNLTYTPPRGNKWHHETELLRKLNISQINYDFSKDILSKKNLLPFIEFPKKNNFTLPITINSPHGAFSALQKNFDSVAKSTQKSILNTSTSPRSVLGLQPSDPTGSGIKIAIIDLGMGGLPEVNFCLNAVADFSKIADFSNLRTPKKAKDPNIKSDHGLRVLSILSDQVFGVAPKASYYLANLKRGPNLSSVILGLLWAAKQKVNIISVSIATVPDISDKKNPKIPAPLLQAIKFCADAGCQIVACTAHSPGFCSSLALSDAVISVGAYKTDNTLLFKSFSIKKAKTDCLSLGENVSSLGGCFDDVAGFGGTDRKSTRLNSSHSTLSRMPSSA